jgi:hypothetical protein
MSLSYDSAKATEATAPEAAEAATAATWPSPSSELLTSSFTRFVRTELHLIMAGRLIGREPRHEQ